MHEGTSLEVSAADRARLEAVVADRNSPQKHVWRARIVLATAEGLGTNAIVRRTGKSKPCVRRWRERFAAEGWSRGDGPASGVSSGEAGGNAPSLGARAVTHPHRIFFHPSRPSRLGWPGSP